MLTKTELEGRQEKLRTEKIERKKGVLLSIPLSVISSIISYFAIDNMKTVDEQYNLDKQANLEEYNQLVAQNKQLIQSEKDAILADQFNYFYNECVRINEVYGTRMRPEEVFMQDSVWDTNFLDMLNEEIMAAVHYQKVPSGSIFGGYQWQHNPAMDDFIHDYARLQNNVFSVLKKTDLRLENVEVSHQTPAFSSIDLSSYYIDADLNPYLGPALSFSIITGIAFVRYYLAWRDLNNINKEIAKWDKKEVEMTV